MSKNYPSFKEMVMQAILDTQYGRRDKKPVSRQVIKKYIHANYDIPDTYWEARSKSGFNRLVDQGVLRKSSGSFYVSEEHKPSYLDFTPTKSSPKKVVPEKKSKTSPKKGSPKKKSQPCYTVHREYNIRDIKTNTIVKTFNTKAEAMEFLQE